ncbi:TIR domain-containing protein [Archangium violaceum]|uniref:nSTAND1 domain-containing NTPase n=1 Tax=Archangium violaceum TaxID=83451 RepID=UPI002B2AD7C4|nr:TIR domain-containing protein [Archangium gephyra]
MFDVFLSHNSQDKPAVAALALRLRDEAKLSPFLDQWSLVPGRAWQPALEKALAQSLSVAVFIGPHGFSSWFYEELRLALDTAARSRDEYRVIPVLLPGAHSKSISGFLAQRTWVDFRDGLDDVVAFNRLVAGIKGQAPEHDTYRLPDEPAPYRGLLSFTKSQARFFFGREREIHAVLDKLKQHPFVALVGASGVGKSSLVLSGVLPQLEHPDSGWGPHLRIRVMTPGGRPLRALADQLATLVPPEARLPTADALARRFAASGDGFRTALETLTAEQPGPFVLVVDQLEELLTCGAHLSSETGAFISNLREAVDGSGGSIRVLVILRADFFGRCLELPVLRALLQEHQVLLGSLSKESLREAIVRPAQEVGAYLEKGLAGTILKDVSHEPGALPLLEHALYELWRARNGAWMTLSAYEATGGVAGALQRRAQSTYEAFTPGEQEIARGLFLRLTALGEGTPDTRRRISRGELVFPEARPEQLEHVLRVLSGPEARLIMADGDWVEVTHEVLIQEWDTLRNWVNTNRRELQVHRRLTGAANEWTEHQRDVSYLYTGSRLLEAEAFFTQEFGTQAPGRLNQRELDFLTASLAHRNEEEREAVLRHREELMRARQLARAEAEKARAARRASWRLRGLALVLILGSTGILGLLGVAQRQQNVALSRELTANALLNLKTDPQLSLALTQEASRFALTEQVTEALEAWRREPGWMLLREHEGAINELSLSPDGGTLATASEDGTARLWDVTTGQSRVLSGHTAPVLSVAFSPDGGTLATASEDGTARLWDVTTGQSHVLSGHTAPVLSVAFSPDGGKLATADNEGTARLWALDTGQSRVLSVHLGPILSVVFSPDGGKLATVGFDGTARLWDVATGQSRVLSGHVGSVWSARFSPDGGKLVTTGSDGTARLWELATGQSRTLTGHTRTVWSARFSPDGGKLVTASEDGTARLWELTTGEGSTVLTGHTAPVLSARFSPDGGKLITASEDGTARLWDVVTGRSTSLLSGHAAAVVSAEFTPDGTKVVSASLDGTARLWDVASSKVSTILAGHAAPVKSARFSPDGGKLVTASEDGTARLWDLRGGKGSTILVGHDRPVWSAEFSPDGMKVVTAGDDGTARLWDVASGNHRIFSGHEGPVWSARFSPDGTRVVTAGDDGTARLWDVASGQSRVLSGHNRPVWSAEFSPDGTKVVTAGDDGTARLWDVAFGQSHLLFMFDKPAWPRPVWSARFSPDGSQVVTASNDGTVRLWDMESGEDRVFAGHQKPVWSAEFSPDGSRIATVSDDGTARLWDVDTGQSLAILSGHEGPVRSAEFSPDGSRIATVSDDGTARLWDVDTGQSLAVLSGHEGPVRFASFSPDGASISTAGADGRARLWPDVLWAPDEVKLAGLESGRSLTLDERQKYLHTRSAPAISGQRRGGLWALWLLSPPGS